MAAKLAVYKCEVCKIIVEVLDEGPGELYCCNQEMRRMDEQTADPAAEKHVPFIEQADGGAKVRVGQNAAHPMTDDHFIEWIELCVEGKVCRQMLRPGDSPAATFACGEAAGATAREYCNVHGLWKS